MTDPPLYVLVGVRLSFIYSSLVENLNLDHILTRQTAPFSITSIFTFVMVGQKIFFPTFPKLVGLWMLSNGCHGDLETPDATLLQFPYSKMFTSHSSWWQEG